MTEPVHFNVRGQIHDGAALFQPVFAGDVAQRYHPNFVKYYAGLAHPQPLARHVRHLKMLLGRAKCDVRGKVVLDAGCGYGVSAILVALMGAEQSFGVDFQARTLQTFVRILDALPVSLPVHPALADAATLPYGDGSFDVMLAVEAISHFRRVDDFFREAARVLRPDGVLIVSDANNGANWVRSWRTRRIWQAFENGPTTEDCHGHKISRTFVQKRREIIAQAFPSLNGAELDALSKGTSGLWKPEILDAVRHYMATGESPRHFYRWGTCPLDPTIGHFGEFLFQPPELRRRMEDFGFRTQLVSHFGGSRGGLVQRLNQALSWQPLTPLSIHVARAFIITARRL
jgi:SAM-dependent methyltransferase